jgi:hypothetical protein
MEPEIALLHSQVPTTCPYPKPAQPSPYNIHLIYRNSEHTIAGNESVAKQATNEEINK